MTMYLIESNSKPGWYFAGYEGKYPAWTQLTSFADRYADGKLAIIKAKELSFRGEDCMVVTDRKKLVWCG